MKSSRTAALVKRQVLLLLGVYYPEHYHGIARYAREAGWILDNLYAQGGLVSTWWRGDGMITLITHPKDYAAFRSLSKAPLVDLSKGWISKVMPSAQRRMGHNQPRVLEDNVAIGRLAASHFLERGFRHIAFFNFGNWWMETERIPAFRRAVEEAGAQCEEIPYYRHFAAGMPQAAAGQREAHRWLAATIRRLPKPLGIFASALHPALTVLRACSRAGASVPEEVAVLGCDDDPLVCDFTPVPLSSVDTNREQQGYLAAQLLDRLMNGQPPPREPILVPPKGVVTRQSTNILAVPHLPVARALRFIWEHHTEPIRTPDIAAAAGMSLRALERAFLRHLHRSMVDELTRRRIEHAKELLLKTDLKAYRVAEQSGFNDVAYFSNVFHGLVGVRPRAFRRRHAAKP